MRIIYTPAVHFIIIGALIFGIVLFMQGGFTNQGRSQIVIPKYHIEAAEIEFREFMGRPPTEEEYHYIIKTLIDKEVLYRYALELGIHKQPVVEERLSKIARFVEENPHEPKSKSERALDALELGLHEGDIVVRRILIDGARRLIRAAVLMRVPNDDMLEAYLYENKEDFLVPAKTRITQITINQLKYGQNTELRANEILSKIRSKDLSAEQALTLEDKAFSDPMLPALTDKELQRRFGYKFTSDLKNAPVGEWYGPISSRYGMHIVYINERVAPYVPQLVDIQEKVKARLLHKLADEWLDLRLEQLKQEYDIIVEEDRSS